MSFVYRDSLHWDWRKYFHSVMWSLRSQGAKTMLSEEDSTNGSAWARTGSFRFRITAVVIGQVNLLLHRIWLYLTKLDRHWIRNNGKKNHQILSMAKKIKHWKYEFCQGTLIYSSLMIRFPGLARQHWKWLLGMITILFNTISDIYRVPAVAEPLHGER